MEMTFTPTLSRPRHQMTDHPASSYETQVLILEDDHSPVQIMRLMNSDEGFMEVEFAQTALEVSTEFRFRG